MSPPSVEANGPLANTSFLGLTTESVASVRWSMVHGQPCDVEEIPRNALRARSAVCFGEAGTGRYWLASWRFCADASDDVPYYPILVCTMYVIQPFLPKCSLLERSTHKMRINAARHFSSFLLRPGRSSPPTSHVSLFGWKDSLSGYSTEILRGPYVYLCTIHSTNNIHSTLYAATQYCL